MKNSNRESIYTIKESSFRSRIYPSKLIKNRFLTFDFGVLFMRTYSYIELFRRKKCLTQSETKEKMSIGNCLHIQFLRRSDEDSFVTHYRKFSFGVA